MSSLQALKKTPFPKKTDKNNGYLTFFGIFACIFSNNKYYYGEL